MADAKAELEAVNNIIKSKGDTTKTADSIKTTDEVNKIRNYFLNKQQFRNYTLWMLGICTAYRCGDILSLKFSDIFEEDKITFKTNISVYEEKTSNLS